MTTHAQKLLFSMALVGALLPLGTLAFLAGVSATPIILTLAFVVLGGGWGLSMYFAHLIEEQAKESASEKIQTAKGELADTAIADQQMLLKHAESLTRLTNDHQSRATDATSSAAQATENATIIASAIEEMNASILEIGRQSDNASAIAESAVGKTKTADEAAASLSDKSDAILSIVELIQNIAKHTNLLALNATIEAARAGDHGKGFAVVANEVKTLANQTAEATTQIETQINEIIESSHNVKSQMSAIEKEITSISSITLTIKKSLHEETAATSEIARSAHDTNKATEAVTAGISHMLVTTEEIRSATEKLGEEAQEMIEKQKAIKNQ